jgi:hypothetical protein
MVYGLNREEGPMTGDDLAGSTMRLAAHDIYDAVTRKYAYTCEGDPVDFGEFAEARVAREHLDGVLLRHAAGGAQKGSDQSYRLAVVDAAFRPNPAVDGHRNADNVREELIELVKPALQDPGSESDAATVVKLYEQAHKTGTRGELASKLSALVQPEALLFLTLECSIRGQTEIVDGSPVTAMALFDYQETTLDLEQLHGLTDPLNWPDCNSAFKSVDPVPGSYWETEDAYGIDIIEDFGVPFLNFRTVTVLSITYVDTPKQKAMIYDLSRANAHLGDGQLAVDRGFARAVDLGNTRRAEALKVVHFSDDSMANSSSWFACLWWDLLSVRTAILCPDRTVTPKGELAISVGSSESGPRKEQKKATPRTPGPLESLVTAWGDLLLDVTRETGGIATRTAPRWPPGEQVTGGKLTSDLIEGFERLTPFLGKGIDLGLKATQQAMDRVDSHTSASDGEAYE